FHGDRLQRRWRCVRFPLHGFCIRRVNRALPQLHAGDRLVAEEPVHPLDDLRDDVLDQGGVRWQHHELQDSVALFPGRKADGLGHADLRVPMADDFGPTRNDARLDEAETAESRAADLRHEFRDRLGRPAARALVGARLGGLLRLVLAFHHEARHAIADRWWIGSRLLCSTGTTGTRGACRGARRRAIRRRTHIESGCRRSCSSRPPPSMSRPITPGFSRAGLRCRLWPPRPKRMSWPNGQGWDTTRAPAISSPALASWRRRAVFPTAKRNCASCPAWAPTPPPRSPRSRSGGAPS